jgi:hypothetical protein
MSFWVVTDPYLMGMWVDENLVSLDVGLMTPTVTPLPLKYAWQDGPNTGPEGREPPNRDPLCENVNQNGGGSDRRADLHKSYSPASERGGIRKMVIIRPLPVSVS